MERGERGVASWEAEHRCLSAKINARNELCECQSVEDKRCQSIKQHKSNVNELNQIDQQLRLRFSKQETCDLMDDNTSKHGI